MQHAQKLHSYIRHRHRRPLFSSAKQNVRSVASILSHCHSPNTRTRLMNVYFQSRFSAQWNTPLSHVGHRNELPAQWTTCLQCVHSIQLTYVQWIAHTDVCCVCRAVLISNKSIIPAVLSAVRLTSTPEIGLHPCVCFWSSNCLADIISGWSMQTGLILKWSRAD